MTKLVSNKNILRCELCRKKYEHWAAHKTSQRRFCDDCLHQKIRARDKKNLEKRKLDNKNKRVNNKKPATKFFEPSRAN